MKRFPFGLGMFAAKKRPVRTHAARLTVERLESREVMDAASVFGFNLLGPGPVVADGHTTDAITGQAWGLPQFGSGGPFTVSTTLGTILTDADGNPANGNQVAVNADFNFTILIQRPATAGTPTLTFAVYNTDGVALPLGGSVDSPSFLSYTSPTVAATATQVASSAATTTYGGAATFTATVNSGNTLVTAGTVTFTTSLGPTTVPLDANGQASLTVTTLPAGTQAVTATYNGTAAFGASAGSVTQTVNRAVLTVTAANAQKTYGQANPVFAALPFAGFVLGEGPSALTGTLTYSTPAGPASPAGSYRITPGGLSSSNYDIRFVDGTLTVAKAQLFVKADDKTKTAGTPNPTFTATYVGFVLGEGPGVLGGTLGFATGATTSSQAGTYAITPGGLTSANYDITFVAGTLTIQPATTPINSWRELGIRLGALSGRLNVLDFVLPSNVGQLQGWFVLANFALGSPTGVGRGIGVAAAMEGFIISMEVYIRQGRFGIYVSEAASIIEEARTLARAAIHLGLGI
ncbi:MAG: MBG domain-containing protein [Gemmataceae bacterium]